MAPARAAELLAEHGGGASSAGRVDVDTRGAAPGRSPLDARPTGVAGVDLRARRRSSRCCSGRLPRSTPTGGRVAGHAAALAPRPDRPRRPGRGGRSGWRATTRSRRCCRRRRPAAGSPPASARRRSVGRALAEAGYVEVPSFPFVGDGGARRARPARRRRRAAQRVVVRNPLSEPSGRRCARRCCPGCWTTLRAQPVPRPARPGAVRASARCSCRAAGATPAPRPRRRPPSGRRDARRAARPRCPAQPVARRRWRWPATASRAAGGARAGRRAGPTRSRSPGGSVPPPGSS